MNFRNDSEVSDLSPVLVLLIQMPPARSGGMLRIVWSVPRST